MTPGIFSKGFFLLLLLFASFTINAQLKADFNVISKSGCSPLLVQFNDLSTGDPTSWKWDLGNGTVSYLQSPSVIYFDPGKYTVKLVIKNDIGADSVVKTQFIEVFSKPNIDFSANTTTGCYPLKVQFTDMTTTTDSSITSWLWDFGDGATSSEKNPSNTFTSAKNFNITLQVKTGAGCVSTFTKPSMIQINNGVSASFTNNNPHTCTAPLTINFQNTSTGTGAIQYVWDFGDGNTSDQPNPSHTYSTNGTYDVSLLLVNNAGCKDSIIKASAVTVGSVKAKIAIPDSACQNMLIPMKNTSTPDPASVFWSFGDGTTSALSNPNKKYTTAGNFNVKLVANFGACSDSVIKVIKMLPKASANFSADKTTSCSAPLTVNFTSQGTNIKSYQWLFGDNTSSTLANTSHTYNALGSYTVKLIVTNTNGCTDTIQKNNFIIVQKPKVTISNVPDSGCVPFTKTFKLTVNSLDPITNYTWDFGDGTTGTGISPTHTYTDENVYNVTVRFTTAGGCTDSVKATRAIITNNKPTVNFDASPLVTCAKTPVSFNDLSSTGISKWLWQFGDSSYSTIQSPMHLYVDTGFFDVQLKIWKGGCTDSLKIKKYVYINAPIAKFTVGNDCNKPFEKTFTDMSIGADQWEWNFGDGSTSTETSPIHTYAGPGNYTVKLRVINNASGCDYETKKDIQIITAKAAFMSADTAICRGKKTNFTNTIPISQISSLNWNFGDGSASVNANYNLVSYTYKTTGSFTVRLILTNANGCKDTLVKPNYININGPSAKFTTKANACLNTTIFLADSSKSDGIHDLQKWVWDYGDGSKDSSATSSFQHLYTQPGAFTVRLRVVDNIGCVDSFKLTTPITIAKPVANFSTVDTLSCPGKQVKFVNQSTGGTFTYAWDFGDNSFDNAKDPLHSYPGDGHYPVKLAIKDQYGCTDSITKQQYVTIKSPTASFSMSDSVTNCPPLIITFNDSSINVLNRKWDFGDSTYSTIEHPIHFYNYPGTYYPKITITAPGGCTAVYQRKVFVKGPQGNFTYQPNKGCSPVVVNFVATTNDENTVLWDFNDGNTLGTSSKTATNIYAHAGTYVPKMILIDPSGCKVPFPGKDTIKMSGITAKFSFDKTLICDSGIIAFKDSSIVVNDAIKTYQWNFGDGKSSNTKDVNHSYTATDTYSPTLVTVTNNGCRDTAVVSAPIKIVASPKIAIKASANGCTPVTISFNSQLLVPDTSKIRWQWDLGNGITSVLATPPSQTYTTGSYNISLTGANSSGCKTTVTKLAESYAIPAVSAGKDTILCYGSSMMLNATGAATYTWSPANGLNCTNCASPVTNTLSNTTYYITGTSVHGCSASDTLSIKVKTKFVFSHSPSDSICKGSTKQLNASGGYTYAWTPSNSLDNASSSTPVASPDTTTTYTVVATDDRNCFKDTGYIAIRVNKIPTVEAGTDQTINVGQSIDLIPTVSNDVTDVIWSPTTGLFRNVYPGITVKPKENTEYTVEVKNKGKCLARDKVTVYVICNGSNIFIPNTFSPNGDGTNDVFYPRGTGVFKIKSLRIFNRWGEVMFERQSFDANNPSYGWDGKSKGTQLNSDVFVYMLEVICDNGSVLTYNGNVALVR